MSTPEQLLRAEQKLQAIEISKDEILCCRSVSP